MQFKTFFKTLQMTLEYIYVGLNRITKLILIFYNIFMVSLFIY